jgi:hypothetical protein
MNSKLKNLVLASTLVLSTLAGITKDRDLTHGHSQAKLEELSKKYN